MNNPEYIVIHHSETRDGGTKDWDAIRRYHKDVKGWRDIGYHYGIEQVGEELTIQYGRTPETVGAHCNEGGMNTKSLGICVVGNFDNKPPTEAILEVLRVLVKSIQDEHNIPANRVLGHKEAQVAMGGVATKTCPGKMLDMDAFRASLEGQNGPITAV